MGLLSNIGSRIASRIGDAVADKAVEKLVPYAEDFAEDVIDSIINDAPPEKTTGGMTGLYLPRITKDFNDFHAEDADTDIKTFILEFLAVTYGKQLKFDKAKISDKVQMNINKTPECDLHDIAVHKIAISDYQKSLNSATIKYKVSVGFAVGGRRYEKLYEVEYTLQLRNEYEEETFLQCQNCGAPLRETDGVCPYCGMKHIRDTIMSWVVTDVVEL